MLSWSIDKAVVSKIDFCKVQNRQFHGLVSKKVAKLSRLKFIKHLYLCNVCCICTLWSRENFKVTLVENQLYRLSISLLSNFQKLFQSSFNGPDVFGLFLSPKETCKEINRHRCGCM